MTFDERRTVAIERGENAGRTITYHNVVREIRPLAEWTVAALEVPLPQRPPARPGRRCCSRPTGSARSSSPSASAPD